MRWGLLTAVAVTFLVVVPRPPEARADSHDPAESAVLTISTVPVVEGMRVMIGDESYVSDRWGNIRVALPLGDHRIEAQEVMDIDGSTRYLFERWNDTFSRIREFTIDRDRSLELAVLIQYSIPISYVNGVGEPFPADRIQSASFINSRGDLVTVSTEEEENEGDSGFEVDRLWMTANRLRRTRIGLISKETVYAAREVNVDGQNVVQPGKVEFQPVPGGRWELQLRVYSLFVDVRSFGLNQPVDGVVGIRRVAPEPDEQLYQTARTRAGVAELNDIPVGDYELTLAEGGLAPATPIVFSGPKTEVFTALTPDVIRLLIGAGAILALSFGVFVWKRTSRLWIMLGWAAALTTVMNLPSIGALSSRFLSLDATPVFDDAGDFVGVEAVVRNTSSLSVSQVYCRPDFELRILDGDDVWSATYESPDFHDVEFGECREHRVLPGETSYMLAPTLNEEWVTLGPRELPAGDYVAYIRLFDIPAPAVSFSPRRPIDPHSGLYAIQDPTLGSEVPFASPFDD